MKSFGDFNSYLADGTFDDHVVEIIPCPYDKTTSYGHGTDKGPEAIIEASQELEFFDDETNYDPSLSFGIKTLEPVKMKLQDAQTEKPFAELQELCLKAYQRGKFPIVLGGEHSLSLGPVKAAYNKCKREGRGMTLLHFDAHADLRDEYLGNPYSHAAAIYQIYKHCPDIKIVSVGIRNISQGEVEWYTKKAPHDHEIMSDPCEDIKIFMARNEVKNLPNGELNNSKSPMDRGPWTETDVLKAMNYFGNDDFYITFDVDGYDSALMPSTGTPEPGGLDWYTPINIIKEACLNFNLIGADIVELAPIKGMHGPDFLVAKLVYKIISYKFSS